MECSTFIPHLYVLIDTRECLALISCDKEIVTTASWGDGHKGEDGIRVNDPFGNCRRKIKWLACCDPNVFRAGTKKAQDGAFFPNDSRSGKEATSDATVQRCVSRISCCLG